MLPLMQRAVVCHSRVSHITVLKTAVTTDRRHDRPTGGHSTMGAHSFAGDEGK